MKRSTISLRLILLSIAVLYAEVTNSSSCDYGVKQCTFESLNDGTDEGQIQTCDFQKVYSSSALRITYQGDLRMISCSRDCCRRWYITINGKECSSPAPIDAIIYAIGVSGLNLHRPGTLDGFCNNIPAGRVTVGLSVGKCIHTPQYDKGHAYTCWDSICRFIIKEVPLMQ